MHNYLDALRKISCANQVHLPALVSLRSAAALCARARHRAHVPAHCRPGLLHSGRRRSGAGAHDHHPHRAGSRHALLRREEDRRQALRHGRKLRTCRAFSARPSSPSSPSHPAAPRSMPTPCCAPPSPRLRLAHAARQAGSEACKDHRPRRLRLRPHFEEDRQLLRRRRCRVSAEGTLQANSQAGRQARHRR